MRRLIAAACLAAVPAGAAAADPRWYLQVDNDVAVATDRWYTSGVRIARVADHDGYELEWGVSQEIYTPEARQFRFGVIDRAPAARLRLGLARHDRTAASLRTLALALGVRGPAALGREASETIHRVVSAYEVDWSRQGDNRLDAELAFAQSHAFDAVELHYGAVLGNQMTHVHAGAALRAGAASAVSTPVLRFAPTPPVAPGARAQGWGAFVGASVRAVARNALLDTGYDPFAENPVRKRAVLRAAAGVAWSQPWGDATFAVAFDTREFASQREPHGFGALAVHLAF